MKSRHSIFSILNSNSSRRGQSLVESIVAISVLTAGFIGIFTLLASALHSNRIIADNSTATYLAAEGIEVTKNILDHNTIVGNPWGSGFSPGDFEVDYASQALSPYAGRNLFFDPAANVYSYSVFGVPTNFKRRITISFPAADEISVNSFVTWTTNQAQSSVNLEDHFLNWRL